MDDLVDEQVNQTGSQSQNECTITTGEKCSQFYSRYYSINAKIIQVCPICHQMCTPHTIKKHLQSHARTEPVCIVCKMVFKTHSYLYDHYLSNHSSGKPFECSICDKSFKTRKYVLRHLKDIHDIKYIPTNCNKEFEYKMDYNEKHHAESVLPAPIVFENFSNFEQQSEYKNVERKYHVGEEGSIVVQGTQEDIANHKTSTKDTISGDKDCHMEATHIHRTREKPLPQNTRDDTMMEATKEEHTMITSLKENMSNFFGSSYSNNITKVEETTRNIISFSNEREVPIPRQCGNSCDATISLRDREEKGKQLWLCRKNFVSKTQPITVSDPVFVLKNTFSANCNTDMGGLQNNNFTNVDEADTLECLNSDNQHNKKEFMLQKSTSDVQYNWILNGNNKEYARALEQEAYFVNQWMTE